MKIRIVFENDRVLNPYPIPTARLHQFAGHAAHQASLPEPPWHPLRSSSFRRDRKKLATRRAIREAALTLFARDGFDSVTVEQITEAADVSAMTFYRHFGSKEAVVTSVATTDQMNHAIGALDRIRIPGEIPDVLDDFFADAASWEAELAERVALVRANQTLVNALWQRSTSWTDAISEVLGPGLDSRIYARVLVGAITETVLAWPDSPEFPSSFALRELIEKTLSSFVNYHQHRGI